MSKCKIVQRDGRTFFQCKITEEPTFYERFGRERLEPYRDDECHHQDNYEYKGELRCRNCPAVYDEQFMEWRRPV